MYLDNLLKPTKYQRLRIEIKVSKPNYRIFLLLRNETKRSLQKDYRKSYGRSLFA